MRRVARSISHPPHPTLPPQPTWDSHIQGESRVGVTGLACRIRSAVYTAYSSSGASISPPLTSPPLNPLPPPLPPSLVIKCWIGSKLPPSLHQSINPRLIPERTPWPPLMCVVVVGWIRRNQRQHNPEKTEAKTSLPTHTHTRSPSRAPIYHPRHWTTGSPTASPSRAVMVVTI